ncbi:M23 family metallopeptidase [Catenovulum sediminis]|uniref:M23 family metallopeptidase n=1 Tax=Catenovulum sediminis TaxID=1740262 RepID=A0ABV1RI66_9ALTE
MTIVIFCLYIVLPIYLLATLFSPQIVRFEQHFFQCIFVTLFIFYIKNTGSWASFGTYWPNIFLLVALLAWGKFFYAFGSSIDWKLNLIVFNKAFLIKLTFIFSSAVALLVYLSFNTKNDGVHLEFPLKNGHYWVVQGGDFKLINHHYPFMGQRFGLDIVKLSNYYTAFHSPFSETLSNYAIFDEEVYAPCSGEILKVENNLIDNAIPDKNIDKPMGNNIVLYCDGVTIVLAHLKQHSVLYKKGDVVKKNTLVARVGNSGNSSEPHLHIHALKGKHTQEADLLVDGEGIPIYFQDKRLKRNSSVILNNENKQ